MSQRIDYQKQSHELFKWNRINVAFRPQPGAYDKAFGLDKAGLS